MDLPCQLPWAVSFILTFHHHVCPGICLGGEIQLMLALPSWKYWLSRYCCGWGQGDWPMACVQPWIVKFGLRDGETEGWICFLMNVNGMNGLRDTESATFHQGVWSPRRLTHVSPNTQGSHGPRHNPRLALRCWVSSFSCGRSPRTSQRRPALPHRHNVGNQGAEMGLANKSPAPRSTSPCVPCAGTVHCRKCREAELTAFLSWWRGGKWNCLPREEGKSSPMGAHLLPIRRMGSGDSCLSARSYCYDHRGNSCTTSTSLSCEIKSNMGTSLVVQGLAVCLPTQGTQVWSLVQEGSAHHRQLRREPMQGTQVWSLVQEGSAHHKATTPRATTTELALWNPRAAATEARTPYSPWSTTREASTRKRPRAAEKRAASPRCN